MKYRIIAACILIAILVVGVFLSTDPQQPSTQSQGSSREDEAMKNLKLP